jgi:hypothetical protein
LSSEPKSITPDQRRDFGLWSSAINKIDDDTRAKEAEAWIASALAILDRQENKEVRGGQPV